MRVDSKRPAFIIISTMMLMILTIKLQGLWMGIGMMPIFMLASIVMTR